MTLSKTIQHLPFPLPLPPFTSPDILSSNKLLSSFPLFTLFSPLIHLFLLSSSISSPRTNSSLSFSSLLSPSHPFLLLSSPSLKQILFFPSFPSILFLYFPSILLYHLSSFIPIIFFLSSPFLSLPCPRFSFRFLLFLPPDLLLSPWFPSPSRFLTFPSIAISSLLFSTPPFSSFPLSTTTFFSTSFSHPCPWPPFLSPPSFYCASLSTFHYAFPSYSSTSYSIHISFNSNPHSFVSLASPSTSFPSLQILLN